MQKYFYPIFKLPDEYEKDFRKYTLPLWVKWWLLGKSARELSQILTGSSFMLTNTVKRRFKKFEVGGNTEQAQYEGKNKLNVPENLSWTGVKTINQTIPAGEYILVWSSFNQGGNENPYIQFQGANVGGNINITGTRNITLTRDATQVLIYSNGYDYSGSQGIASTINQLMLLPATETNRNYEPFVRRNTSTKSRV